MKKILFVLAFLPTLIFAQSQLELPYSIKVLTTKPLDAKYFNTSSAIYTDVAEVKSQLTAGLRYRGLTVNVAGVEYWFAAGIADGDLVIKDAATTLTGAVTGTGTGTIATTIATPGTLTVSSTNSTVTAHTHAITSSPSPGAAASILATNSSGHLGVTGTRIVKIWATDLTVTNAIAASITGNAATVTTNANLTGHITSVGNAAVLGSFTVTQLSTAISDANISGNNSGDQTSIVGITGTKAQFNTAATDGDFLFVGDITQYTDEMAQDAVGAMVDASLTYVDGTPLLQRAALTGDATASAGSNALTLASVNSNVGTYGSTTQVATITVNAKGLITAVANNSITGLLSGLTSDRIAFASSSTTLIDDADLTFTGGNLLTATNATVTTALKNTALTSGRVPVIGSSGLFLDDAGLTYSTGSDILTLTGASGSIDVNGGSAVLGISSGGATVNFQVSGFTSSGQYSINATTSTIILNSIANSKTVTLGANAAVYGADYSASYNNRSLIDKGFFSDISASCKTKIVDIGDWNMDANSGVNVAHGLVDHKQIRSIFVVIRNDADMSYENLSQVAVAGSISGAAFSWDATNILLSRTTSGGFDGPNYDSTSYNRGYVYIVYVDSF